MQRITLLALLLGLFLVSGAANYTYLMVHAAHFTDAGNAPGIPNYVASIGKEIVLGHAIPLVVLIGGICAKKPGRGKVRVPIAVAAVALSLVWIGYVSSAWVGYPDRFAEDQLQSQLDENAKEGTVFTAGIFAYLCGSEEKEPDAG